MKTLKRMIFTAIAAAAFITASEPWAATITISTSAHQGDRWRTIAPVGNLEGLPISQVGLAWEAANVGWNTSLTFDDSAESGWRTPVPRDVSIFGGTSTNNIWSPSNNIWSPSFKNGSDDTPAYFRKVFVLDAHPTSAHFGSNIPEDYSNVVDDDVQIYINGELVFNDTDGPATFMQVTDVTGFLRPGPNLLAVKAHDSFGGFEHLSLTLSITGASETCINPPEGITGWWPGDDNTSDIVGGRNAVLKNGAAFAPSLVAKGFRLDGIKAFVEVPHNPALNVGTGDFTVELWVNFDTTAGEQVLVEKYVEDFGFTPPGWFVTKLDDNSLRFGTGPAETGHGVTSVPLSLPNNTWIHFAARRRSGLASIFVNGMEVATGSFVDNANSDSSLKFGHRGSPDDTPGSDDTRGFFLNGRIDEVGFFVGRALSDEEIRAIFNAGSAGKCKNVNDFVAFEPIRSTDRFRRDTSGCPAGFVGIFSFDATLTNISDADLTNLRIAVTELSGGNLLLTKDGLLGEGERFSVPRTDGFTDARLSPGELLDVPFAVCLQARRQFRLIVDVLGTVLPPLPEVTALPTSH